MSGSTRTRRRCSSSTGNDPSDSFDRESFNDFKRILLSEEDCADGPEATIELIRSLLEKFADYTPQRS